jgi:hypothetical protein
VWRYTSSFRGFRTPDKLNIACPSSAGVNARNHASETVSVRPGDRCCSPSADTSLLRDHIDALMRLPDRRDRLSTRKSMTPISGLQFSLMAMMLNYTTVNNDLKSSAATFGQLWNRCSSPFLSGCCLRLLSLIYHDITVWTRLFNNSGTSGGIKCILAAR